MKLEIVYLTADMLLEFCQSGTPLIRISSGAIPADARVVRIFVNPEAHNQIGLVVESEAFEDVSEGYLIPPHRGPYFEKIDA